MMFFFLMVQIAIFRSSAKIRCILKLEAKKICEYFWSVLFVYVTKNILWTKVETIAAHKNLLLPPKNGLMFWRTVESR